MTVGPGELEVDVLGCRVDADAGFKEVGGDGVDSVGGTFVGQLGESVRRGGITSDSSEDDAAATRRQ